MNDEEKKGLEIIEENEFDSEVSEEELQKFYEENQDAIDLMGGLDMFESLMSLDDEKFEQLQSQFLQLFAETLHEPESISEFRALAIAQGYTKETAKADFEMAIAAINEIDFLSEAKKDFLKQIYTLVSNQLTEIIGSNNKVIRIPCELTEGSILPTYAHDTDAGLDIYAQEEYTIAPGETIIIPTGIKCAIPDGYAILIQPRSGQSAKTKLRIANTPGLIDAGYRDEIGVIVENIEPPFKDIDYEFDDNGEIHIKSILHGQSYTIAPGQRFAQMRLVQVPKAEFVRVESVGEIGEDRSGGFGSTGI
jgi:dUTP pyrophosphatase